MPATTPGRNLPYPLGTDRLMDGDDQIRKLAQSVENMIQTARLTVPITAAQTAVTVTFTFAVAFSAAPTSITVTPIGGTGAIQNQLGVAVVSLAATNCVIGGVRQVGSGSMDVFVTAVGPVAAVA